MIIKKILNNNVVISENSENEEVVVMGRGIAFQKSKGEKINPAEIQKIFTLRYQDLGNAELLKVFTSFDPLEIELASEIIRIAEVTLDREFQSQIYLTLTDHIHYALERLREGIIIPNPLLYDIQRFYPKEYDAATHAIAIIEKAIGIQIPKDELGFIALHFANSSSDNVMITYEIMEIIHDILQIISNFFGIVLEEKNVSFQRMVTHIQYFVQRLLTNQRIEESEDDFLSDLVMSKYEKSFNCALMVRDYFKNAHNIKIHVSEIVYLAIHINRVTQKSN